VCRSQHLKSGLQDHQHFFNKQPFAQSHGAMPRKTKHQNCKLAPNAPALFSKVQPGVSSPH
jgi:hypothetical protein